MNKQIILKKKTDVDIPPDELAEPQELFFPSEEEQNLTGFMPIIVNEILKSVRGGMKLEDAAKALKLPPRIVLGWYNKNKGNFRYAVDSVSTENKQYHVVQVQKGNKASAWWLERVYKNEFSKEVTVNVNHRLIDSVSQSVAQALIEEINDPDLLRRIGDNVRAKLNAINLNNIPVEVN